MQDTSFWRNASTGARLAIGGFALFMVAALLIGAMAVFGFGWFARTTADFRGETNAREQTRANGTYRIQAYEQFFNACQAIAAKERIIARYETDVETATGPQKARLEAALGAERNVRDEMIGDYNADAAKHDTRGHFRASSLPHQIDPEGTTSCR